MNKQLIIGLSGKKQSGKDTTADIIQELCSPTHTILRLGFADEVYKELAEACGVAVSFIKENKEIFRKGLQFWGGDFRRTLHGESYWIVKALEKIVKSDASLILITDCRYLNEASFIKAKEGRIWRVERMFARTNIDDHPSECELDDYNFDAVIENKFSLEDLRENVLLRLKTENIL